MRTAWVGRALIAVGVIHTAFGVVGFRGTWSAIVRAGIWNTMNGQVLRQLAFWFILCGLLLVLVGTLVHSLERTREDLPGYVGWSLLGLTLATIVAMPVSGGWLLIPATVGAFMKRARRPA